ncbi:MAG TPA: prenyltransferase [Anaerolineae bacterium]|nr:prenyltransferase [Anaerolineae bacterium]
MNPQKIWAFIKLTRPMFLGGAVVLYLLGAALAWSQGIAVDWLHLLLGQLLVTSVQLTTHYANEYYDYEVDAAIGSARTPFSGGSGVLVSGQLDRAVALHATHICLALAVIMIIVCGLMSPLMYIIGVLGLLGGYFYSAPPLQLEASGFGELNTAILTALFVPVTGYVMQANHLDPIVVIICAPFVLIYLAMILTFEFPDYAADKMIGKRNITVRIGLQRAAWLHNALLLGGLALMFFTAPNNPFLWLIVPLAVWQIAGVVWRSRSGWRHPALLSGGAVLLAGLVPALWLIDLIL